MAPPYGYAETPPKPTYEELLARIAELEKELSRYRTAETIYASRRRIGRNRGRDGWMSM